MMARIFISYRREDSSGYAGRLQGDLAEAFGDKNVFQDIEGLEPGANYQAVIANTIERCDAVLVLIGTRWLEAKDRDGKRRLDDPDDLLCEEIASALKRSPRVIPVLVRRAQMPPKSELPELLQPLSDLHAHEISDERWDYDVARLIEKLDLRSGRKKLYFIAVAAAIAVIGVALWAWRANRPASFGGMRPVSQPPARVEPVRREEPRPAVRAEASRVEVVRASASSRLDPMSHHGERRTYEPGNAVDGDHTTAWACDGGKGQSLRFRFGAPVALQSFSILGGYGIDQPRFITNNRVKTFRISLAGGQSRVFELEDTMKMQDFSLPRPVRTDSVTLEILDVFPGTKYDNTVISEVAFFGAR